MNETDANTFWSHWFIPMILCGEWMQQLALEKTIEYNFMAGHLSDFGLAGFLTCLGLRITQKMEKKVQFIGATLPAMILTAREYYPIIPYEATIDHWDTFCYWVAAGVAITGIKYFSSENYQQ